MAVHHGFSATNTGRQMATTVLRPAPCSKPRKCFQATLFKAYLPSHYAHFGLPKHLKSRLLRTVCAQTVQLPTVSGSSPTTRRSTKTHRAPKLQSHSELARVAWHATSHLACTLRGGRQNLAHNLPLLPAWCEISR